MLDPRKCITCGRCIQVCQEQRVFALSFLNRGFETRIAAAGDISMADSPCVRCGQCSNHCPTGAIVAYGKPWMCGRSWKMRILLRRADRARRACGHRRGLRLSARANLTGKIASLRRMGFKAVFDTNFGADLTIMEEATEFKERLLERQGRASAHHELLSRLG